jgi:primosomal protein N' (replication factor Y)
VPSLPIAKVEPLTTARALRGPFDYRLTERFAEVRVGTVLRVPFGRQRLFGVVVDLAAESELPSERLAEPLEALDAATTPELVRLGLWVADAYASTPARGLELVLAPGTTGRGGRGPVGARKRLHARITAAGERLLAGQGDDARLGARQRAALERLAGAGEVPVDSAERDALRRLERRGLVELRELAVARRPEGVAVGARGGEPPQLNADQRRAVERIERGIDAGGSELLLHGVTGSGKTEVYLTAAAAALARGLGVIVLVPEIGLTPQTVSRFVERFGDDVAVLHSGLSAGERRDEWIRLRTGEARVCVGPRSAVFAPLPALGLLIVDEEHDTSYKQESDPRYDAREVARKRAADAGAVFVAGSATPRPESWQALERLSLPSRADGAPLPPVEILDMRGRDGRAGPLHERTRAALAALRTDGGKAIVMAPRRGWSPHLSCRQCGRAWGCPNCDVSLVLHRGGDVLRCHHCGHRERPPQECPDCGSHSVARHGLGSERLEAIVSELIAPLPVFRLDSDTAAARGAHARILTAFEQAEGGVLLGTQMVGKGHDFPDVVLAVIVDADASLRFPDFRAEERTFALVAQLAGRSGRGGAQGRVLVQTYAPSAEAIELAARHDAAAFLESELERRERLSYPPAASVVRVELTAPEAQACEAAAAQIAARLRPLLPEGATLLGPAPRFRLRGRERRQVLIKAPERERAVAAVRTAVEAAAGTRVLRGVNLAVDVDPQ